LSLLPGALRAKHQKPLAPQSWYWEPEEAIHALFAALPEIGFDLKGPIHDPGCGSGRIPRVARSCGYEATGSDLVDRGYGVGGVDFFTDWTLRQTLMFNPPGGGSADPTLSTRFVLHALEVAEQVAIIVPVPWQCGQKRRDSLFKPYPPVWVAVLGKRFSMPPGGTNIKPKGGTTDYCWILWQRGFAGETRWRSI
jgi:hypothetical protein